MFIKPISIKQKGRVSLVAAGVLMSFSIGKSIFADTTINQQDEFADTDGVSSLINSNKRSYSIVKDSSKVVPFIQGEYSIDGNRASSINISDGKLQIFMNSPVNSSSYRLVQSDRNNQISFTQYLKLNSNGTNILEIPVDTVLDNYDGEVIYILEGFNEVARFNRSDIVSEIAEPTIEANSFSFNYLDFIDDNVLIEKAKVKAKNKLGQDEKVYVKTSNLDTQKIGHSIVTRPDVYTVVFASESNKEIPVTVRVFERTAK